MEVDGGAKPYMLKVEVDNSGQVLYSFAEEGGTANITPMTNLALHEANKNGTTYSDLSALFSEFASNHSRISPAVLNDAKAKVNANLATLLSDESVENGYDFFKTAFSPDGNGIDAVLDALDITIGTDANAGTISINLDGAGFTDFFAGIDIGDFTIGGSGDNGNNGGGATGTWTVVVATTVSGFTTEVTITDFPAAAVPTGDNSAAINAAQEEFNNSFGELGSVSNFSFTFVSSSDTQVVTRTTATITTPAIVVNGMTVPGTSISYSQTVTYTKS